MKPKRIHPKKWGHFLGTLQEAKAISNKKAHNDLSGFSWFLHEQANIVVNLVVPSGKRLHNYIAIKKAIEIVDLPSYKMVFFHGYVNVYRRVTSSLFSKSHLRSYLFVILWRFSSKSAASCEVYYMGSQNIETPFKLYQLFQLVSKPYIYIYICVCVCG